MNRRNHRCDWCYFLFGLHLHAGLAATDLDAEIWGAIGTDDIDIRIADQEQRVTPHLLRKAGRRETRTVRHRRASRIETLSDSEANQLQVRIVLEENIPGANLVYFSTPLRDFEKLVTVWGITDNNSENLLAKQARIFDYSRFADVRETSVILPEGSTQYRAFRLLIEDVVDETHLPLRWETRIYDGAEEIQREEHRRIQTRPFRMNAVHLYEQKTEDAGSAPYMAPQTFQAISIRQARDPAATIIETEHSGAPLNAIRIDCADANFSRRMIVEIPVRRDGRETWRQISAGQMSRIAFREVQHASLQLDFPETRSLRYRVTLFDHDNPPLENLVISGKGPVWQAVFLAEPHKQYLLHFGQEGRPNPPRYDLAPLERLLRLDHDHVQVPLLAQIDNPLYQTSGFILGEQATRILFGIAIVVLC